MTRAVRPLLEGFDYQARWFWNEALRLFAAVPTLERVSIEPPEPRGFDDIVSHPHRPRESDVWGTPVAIDGYQAKFHVDHSRQLRVCDFTDPAFLRTKTSLLERLAAATAAAKVAGKHGRFTLITPWRPDDRDLVGRLCGTDGQLRMTVLFDDTSDRSATGKVRKAWREHLGLADDDELRELLTHLRIWSRDVIETNRELDRQIEVAGLEPVDPDAVAHPYVGLILSHVRRGELEFDMESLRRCLASAKLWRRERVREGAHQQSLAICSRRLWQVHLEDETSRVLDLVPLFHDRDLATGIDWNTDVARRIRGFLERNVEAGKTYRLYLDAHGAIAFGAGWHLYRSHVVPMQLTEGRVRAWPASGPVPSGELWQLRSTAIGSSAGPDIALALSVTHDIRADVARFIHDRLPSVGQLLALQVPAVGRTAVVDGAHANALAVEAVRTVSAIESDGRPRCVHVFAAAPNAFLFQLGRNGHPLGGTTVYEFDLENPHRGYTPAITVPWTKEV